MRLILASVLRYDANGKPFVYLEFIVGSWGGGPCRDGMDACTGVITNYSNTLLQVLVRVHEKRLLERGLADFVIVDSAMI